jgi:hypothetical protein
MRHRRKMETAWMLPLLEWSLHGTGNDKLLCEGNLTYLNYV